MSTVKWRKENTRVYSFRLTKNVDRDLIDWVERQPNKNDYFRQLVRDDISRKNSEKAEQ